MIFQSSLTQAQVFAACFIWQLRRIKIGIIVFVAYLPEN